MRAPGRAWIAASRSSRSRFSPARVASPAAAASSARPAASRRARSSPSAGGVSGRRVAARSRAACAASRQLALQEDVGQGAQAHQQPAPVPLPEARRQLRVDGLHGRPQRRDLRVVQDGPPPGPLQRRVDVRDAGRVALAEPPPGVGLEGRALRRGAGRDPELRRPLPLQPQDAIQVVVDPFRVGARPGAQRRRRLEEPPVVGGADEGGAPGVQGDDRRVGALQAVLGLDEVGQIGEQGQRQLGRQLGPDLGQVAVEAPAGGVGEPGRVHLRPDVGPHLVPGRTVLVAGDPGRAALPQVVPEELVLLGVQVLVGQPHLRPGVVAPEQGGLLFAAPEIGLHPGVAARAAAPGAVPRREEEVVDPGQLPEEQLPLPADARQSLRVGGADQAGVGVGAVQLGGHVGPLAQASATELGA